MENDKFYNRELQVYYPPKSVSVVIPALNEEGYIHDTLMSVAASVRDYGVTQAEIVVADSGSTDGTVDVVNRFAHEYDDIDVSVAKAEERGVSRARNAGAEHAEGNLLVFLDADTKIFPDFLANVQQEMQRRKLDVAGSQVVVDSGKWIDKIIASLGNLHGRLQQHSDYPLAIGAGMMATKAMHKEIGGFNKKIRFCEDMDYACRGSKVGNFGILTDPGTKIVYSTRRFEEEGTIDTIFKAVQGQWHYHRGTLETAQIKYPFGKHGKKPKNDFKKLGQ